MKYNLKFLIFFIAITLILIGCSQEPTPMIKARILVGFGPSMDFCLMDINEVGVVEYISCDINHADISKDDVVKEIYEKKTICLSRKNKTIINEIIKKIISNEPKDQIQGSDFIEIRAYINGKMYHSIYKESNTILLKDSYDENLAQLCYKLVDLAPLNVGGNDNPLEVPEDYDA